MKVGIMQPYFLPYIGYFQLIKAVDLFVFYDDVNFIKQGWINRNRILLNGNAFLFTLELKGSSSFKEINSIELGKNRNKLLRTFEQAYKKAPLFKEVYPLLNLIFDSTQNNLSKYIFDTHRLIAKYLEINTELLCSSEIDKNKELKGQNKVIDICTRLRATKYYNAIGGQNLYSKADFEKADVSLFFLQPIKTEYRQFENEFIPWLSIIDIMMFNSVERINNMLDNFELL